MVSGYIIAKFQTSVDVSLMAMIANDTIHFFDDNGNNVERDALALPDVFVLDFIEDENRSFILVNEKEHITQGNIYVININNKVIYASSNEETYNAYTRITKSSIILGSYETDTESHILIPSITSGRLIENNQLTSKSLIGVRNNYYLFSEESRALNEFQLYALRPKFYDADEPELAFIRNFQADFLLLWESKNLLNVIYYHRDSENSINVKAYDAGGYYWDSPKEQSFHIDIDLNTVNWTNDVQILQDEDSIILHHINASTDYKGFTVVIEQFEYGKFKLCNQNRLTSRNGKIHCYANSLIKFDEGLSGLSIYDRYGNKIATAEHGYDYVKKRPHIRDYAVFTGNLSIPKMKYPDNVNIRFGIISTDTLEMVVPPNFNKVDFIVLEEPIKKHYREKDKYEIYIKVCIETINKQNQIIENWGLFKHSECMIPCFYKSIDLIQLNNSFVLICENQEGFKCIFYNDRSITDCIYEKIEESGSYLLMTASDGLIDVFYVDKHENQLFKSYISATPVSGKDSLIVIKNSKYGLICKGQFVAECIYDKIELTNVYPMTQGIHHPQWFVLHKGEKKGLYGTEGVMTDIVYDDVAVIDWQTYHHKRYYSVIPERNSVLELNGRYYTATEKKLICENEELTFRGFISSDKLVFSDEDATCVEFYTHRGEKREVEAFDSDGDFVCIDDFNDIESFYLHSIYALPIPSAWRMQNIQINISEYEYIFSLSENRIIHNPFYKDIDNDGDQNDSDYHDNDYPDDTDYERDTFYALGGDDYDEWRNNGGNLDDMMDGMGF